jgi:hypothetical protein
MNASVHPTNYLVQDRELLACEPSAPDEPTHRRLKRPMNDANRIHRSRAVESND